MKGALREMWSKSVRVGKAWELCGVKRERRVSEFAEFRLHKHEPDQCSVIN